MFFGFIDWHTIFSIFHLLGVALGVGGAFLSDAMFFSSAKDGRISASELKFLKLGSKMVWIGIFILVVSGLLIFSGNTERYLNSSKFLAKMTVVGVIILNGVIFHVSHIPFLRRHADLYMSLSKKYREKMPSLIVSGVVSVVSWLSALVLGSLRSVPYSYFQIMGFYLVILGAGIVISLLLKKLIFPAGYQGVKR